MYSGYTGVEVMTAAVVALLAVVAPLLVTAGWSWWKKFHSVGFLWSGLFESGPNFGLLVWFFARMSWLNWVFMAQVVIFG